MCASYNPTTESYLINYANKPGLVFVINNKFFLKGKNRFGSEKDVRRLSKTFADLNFEVKTYLDKTADEIRTCIQEMTKIVYKSFGCVLVFLMSHGTEGKIFGIDGEAVYLTDFFDSFKSIASLKGKPKLFFVNACRGNQYSPIHKDNLTQEEMNNRPEDADCLYCFSTTANYYSMRESNGSWFIQILCDMIEKYKSTKHLVDILTRVNREVAKQEGWTEENELVKMISTYTSQLTRDFYFSQPINVKFILIFSKHFYT